VMDAIPVSVFWKDTGLNYLGCNLQFAKDAGVSSPRDLIGRNDLSLVWRDHAERYRIDDLRVMQSGTPKLNYEEPSTGPDGKTFWVKTNKIPMRDSSGHITGVLGCYEDITERKQSEQELKQRADDMHLINTLNQANNRGEDLTRIAERLSWETRRIFLCNAVVIYLLNEDRTQLVLINTRVLPEDVRDGIENMFGFRPPERFNIPLREDSELWRLCFSAEPHLINEPESITSLLIEFTGGRKIRRLMPKLIEVMRIHSLIAVPLVSNREVIGALGVSRAEPFTDNELQRFSSIAEHLTAIITRKKVEEGLLIRNAALQASINAFAIFDIIGRITYVNDAFLKTWGFDRYTEILGRHAVIIWSDLEEGRIAIKELHERGRWGGEMRAARRSGSEFTALAQATVVRGEDGVPICFASSFIDITQRKDAAREMERLNAELEKKNKELEQIIYVTSHDLRTPLVNIQGFARELEYSLQDMAKVFEEENLSQSVLEKMEPILDKDIPLALGYINKSVAKMDSLLAGLLQLSRLGRAEFLMQPLDMNQLMVDVLASLEFQIEERNASLEIGDLPPCLGDQIQLNRVFSNLLDNAIKYLEPDRPGEVSLTGEVSGDRVVYQIKDNGIGIAERDIERIFEIFHQLNPVASQGEGLGLTIVQRILERHNGRIWVESHLGVGSVFYVSLPAAPST